MGLVNDNEQFATFFLKGKIAFRRFFLPCYLLNQIRKARTLSVWLWRVNCTATNHSEEQTTRNIITTTWNAFLWILIGFPWRHTKHSRKNSNAYTFVFDPRYCNLYRSRWCFEHIRVYVNMFTTSSQDRLNQRRTATTGIFFSELNATLVRTLRIGQGLEN